MLIENNQFEDIEYELRKASIQWSKQKNDIPVVPLHVALEMIIDFKSRSIEWSVADFQAWAMDTYGKGKWKKIYDPSKFQYALETMIKQHDCTIGITWETIDYYLNQYCCR